jgi:hypothetical protein
MVARCHFLQRQTTSTPILRTTANDVPYYVSTNFAEGRQDMRRVEEQVWFLFCFVMRVLDSNRDKAVVFLY